MNIKKLIASSITVLVVMVTATCFAQISKSDLNIGGMYYGQSWADVVAMYGQPDWNLKLPTKKLGYIFDSVKGGQFMVIPENGIVTGVSLTTNNVLTTGKGIHIGSTIEEVLNAYGRPDKDEAYNNSDRNFMYIASKEQVGEVFLTDGMSFTFSFGKVKWINFSESIESVNPAPPMP